MITVSRNKVFYFVEIKQILFPWFDQTNQSEKSFLPRVDPTNQSEVYLTSQN